MDIGDLITIDPEILGGTPVFKHEDTARRMRTVAHAPAAAKSLVRKLLVLIHTVASARCQSEPRNLKPF